LAFLPPQKWHCVGNFIASQNCRSCQFADKRGHGEHYSKRDVILGKMSSTSALVCKLSLTKVLYEKVKKMTKAAKHL